MAKFRYIDDLLQAQEKTCAHPNCSLSGEHRAPISHNSPREFQYLCLEHVKEFNKKWDYFKEKSQEEIESFQKDSFTGHRPTWKVGSDPKHRTEKLYEALNGFMGDGYAEASHYAPPLTANDRRALEQLDLEHPTDEINIKKRYKKLARQHHPDRNHGDKQAEERFKEINSSYRHLLDNYCENIS